MSDQTNPADDDLEDTPEATREWFAHMVATEGLRVAYATAVGICQDSKAAAPAKATALTALLRSAGAFNTKEDAGRKDPSTMTLEEMDREIQRLERRRRKDAVGAEGAPPQSGAFD